MTATGQVYVPTDVGEIWQQKNSDVYDELLGIGFLNAQLGLPIGRGVIILKTIGADNTWVLLNKGYTGNLSQIIFVNQLKAWALDEDILHASDGVVTQSERRGFENCVKSFQVIDDRNGFLFTVGGAPHHHIGSLWK